MRNQRIKAHNRAMVNFFYKTRDELIKKEQGYLIYDPVLHQASLRIVRQAQKLLDNLNFVSVDDFGSVKRLLELGDQFSKFSELDIISFTACQQYIPIRIHQRAVIEIALDELAKKADDLQSRQHYAAAETAHHLLLTLRSLTEAYFVTNSINFATYRQETSEVIENSRPILEKHRGYKKILGNLLVLIFTLGAGFLINKAYTGQFFFFNGTKTGKQLKNLTQLFDYSLPPPGEK
jgi:hypothetical protein